MNDAGAAQRAWLDLVQEDILDPERPIVDPHHHLWRHPGLPEYLLEDLWADTGSGHNVGKTVFMECGAEYREDGPEELRSLLHSAGLPAVQVQRHFPFRMAAVGPVPNPSRGGDR